MKLSYSNSYNYMNLVSLGLLIAFLMVLFIIHMLLLDIKSDIYILFIFMEILTIVGIIYIVYSIKKENVIRNQELWRNGEKYLGNIVDIGYTRKTQVGMYNTIEKVSYFEHNTNHNIIDYHITILYNNSYYIDIKSIKYDKAYKLLAMSLISSYPIKEKLQIPIEIYKYKNKVYADLNSIDLTKVKGYEECKKLIEKSIN